MDGIQIQLWLIFYYDSITYLRYSYTTLTAWLVKIPLPWAAYHVFMIGCIIVLDKHPGVRLLDIGGVVRHLITNSII